MVRAYHVSAPRNKTVQACDPKQTISWSIWAVTGAPCVHLIKYDMNDMAKPQGGLLLEMEKKERTEKQCERTGLA
ncbi:hypothetical protein JCGZ_01882 [Jatropha curcas]|uniref:Uncharacterized protein n=1 Tax=Jatropha curcas TaxID=180498 RepID=A0A067LDC6_JATCU|nr:hypothetical protein JCGZ_01882 [Jatropha curcas]